MDTHLIGIFCLQIETQCEFILIAAGDLNAAHKNDDGQRTFYSIQALLTASANVSKALWGQEPKQRNERKPLRDSLGIDDTSPFMARGMRNKFDHFDERLDEWWAKSEHHQFIDMNISNLPARQDVWRWDGA